MARKEKNIHYIYKTTCNVTGRWYIGMHSTNNEDDGYMGSGKRLRYSIRKYGVENHTKEILEYCKSREELVETEKKTISDEILNDSMCMNLMSGGTGGFISVEQQRYRSQCAGKAHAKKILEDAEYRLEHRKRVSENLKLQHQLGKMKYDNFKGKNHSEETKILMSQSSKGKGVGESNSQYGTCWITRDGENKKIKKEDLGVYLKEGWIGGKK